jgi:hypothetical protein
MIRVFAGVYHELVVAERESEERLTDSEATNLLAQFADHMSIPIDDEGAWRATGLFKESGVAPEASQGDVRKLVDTIVGWLEDDPYYRSSKPGWLST